MSEPGPPKIVRIPGSAWAATHCWECDLPARDGGDEAVVWDGRIWHAQCWRGDLNDVRHGRVVACDSRTTTSSGAGKPPHKG